MSATTSTPSKFCYFFGIDAKKGENLTEGNRNLKELLGGKGANLSEMCNLGVPVPPGFTISTEANVVFNKHNNYASNIDMDGEKKVTKDQLPQQIIDEVNEYLTRLETISGKKFGSFQQEGDRVLLVSVRRFVLQLIFSINSILFYNISIIEFSLIVVLLLLCQV